MSRPPKAVSDYMATIGRKGGKAGKGKRNPEQARKAARARWDKQKGPRK